MTALVVYARTARLALLRELHGTRPTPVDACNPQLVADMRGGGLIDVEGGYIVLRLAGINELAEASGCGTS